jgi:hypothetical protein
VRRRGIGRQLQRTASGSTHHDRVTVRQIRSSRSLALDRPRQSTPRHPPAAAHRRATYRVRRLPPRIHQRLRRRTTRCTSSIQISKPARGTQIPIALAAPPYGPHARFPPLEAFGRRPRPARHHLHGAGIRNPSQKRPLSAPLDRGVVIERSVMRSLYRGLFVHVDSLWQFSYAANTIIHVCFSQMSGPRDSDYPRPTNRLSSREMPGRRQPPNPRAAPVTRSEW